MVGDHRENIKRGRGEMLGLPGVGKSWVAQNRSEAFPLTAKLLLIPQGRSIGKLFNVARGMWLGRVLLPLIIHLLLTNMDKAWRRYLRSVLLIFERLGRQARKPNHHQVINDEGVLQALWSLVFYLRFTGNNLVIFNKLFYRAFKFTGSVYYVSCPRNLYVSRMRAAGVGSDDIRNSESLSERECMAFVLWQARKQDIKIHMVKNIRSIKKANDMKKPFVSVVIPMRNEAAYIKTCLQSLLKNDYPADLLEILVVDGISSDKSREIVIALIKTNANIRLVSNPDRITPTALNVGIEEAKGDVVVRMDVHSIYPTDYIRRCVENLVKYGADNVGGLWDIQPGADTCVAKAIALAQSHPVGVGNVAYRLGSEGVKWVDTVPYGCYKKETLEKLGGFDTELIRNQDDELNARLRKAGGKILLDPSIKCTYFSRPTLKQIGHMFFQYGYFKPLAARKVGKAYTIRQIVPPLFVAVIIILSVGAVFSQYFFWLFIILLFIYFSTIIVAAVSVGLKEGVRAVTWMPIVFTIMHFSYGVGSLKGMVDFFIRKKSPRDVPLTR